MYLHLPPTTATPISPSEPDWSYAEYPSDIGPSARELSENFKLLQKLPEPDDWVQDINIVTLADQPSPANDGTGGIEHTGLDTTLWDVPTMTDCEFDPAMPYLELTYERPHPLHIPTDIETNMTRAKMHERNAQIMAIQKRINGLRARFEAEREEALAKLRPIMDLLHNRIITIQQRMASLWSEYAEGLQKAERKVQAIIANLNSQIHTLETENTNATSFLAPIRRLPVEMLAEVFYWAICGNGHPPLQIARVNQSWRAAIFSLPRMWSTFRFTTCTRADKIDFILERTVSVPLDVEMDTEGDVLRVLDEKKARYAGMESVLSVASRWRTLTITSFPSKVDIDAHWTPEKSTFTLNGPIDAFESFKIKDRCEDSPLFGQLLDAIGNSSHERLLDMELSSPNAIYHLSQPQFTSIFRRLVTFKVNVREMRTEVDILPHFEHLEVFEASRLRLPMYTPATNFPFVRTLKRMKIKSVSVQWMAGRTFYGLEECIIIWPHCPETLLRQGGGVYLPACTHFAYDDRAIDALPSFGIPKLDTFTVKNEAWNKERGSTQLAAVWNGAPGHVAPLKPRVLHLETQCHDQHLINALTMLPELEELYLGEVRPGGLGKTFFGALQVEMARPLAANHVSVLCPNLRTLGVRYRPWFHDDESDDITPMLHKVVESRRKTDTPLESLKFWSTKETPDDSFHDLCTMDPFCLTMSKGC